MTEAVAVEPKGRISPQDLGIWNNEQASALKPVTEFIKSQGAVPAIQLAHAGRKAGTYRPWSLVRGQVPVEDGGWDTQVAPSPITFNERLRVPRELTTAEVEELVVTFQDATRRSVEAGFEVIELHAAHGYLLHQFLSPISNQRTDQYGGSFENRTRVLREMAVACRKVMSEGLVLMVRISATDWVEGGWTIEESVRLASNLKEMGVDLFDCSSGGSTPDADIPSGPGYQVTFAEQIRREAGMPTGAVGGITEAQQAEEIVASGQADLVFLGRELLRNPYWPQAAAHELGADRPWPNQYGWAVRR
jgi:2,4-dienoyl-CoA reductase-like NADH-dependent reductase (Old Yellow Enzyme family)